MVAEPILLTPERRMSDDWYTKLQLVRARAIAYDEGYKAFCKTREDERVCPYAGNLMQPWQDGWNDAEKQFTEATTDL